MKHFAIFLSALLLFACSAKVRTTLTNAYPALSSNAEVAVVGLDEATPQSAIEIGEVKIGDTGFTKDCGMDVAIEKAKTEARLAGGNVLKIVQHTPPSVKGSSCHRIIAKIMKLDDPEELAKIIGNNSGSRDTTWDFAILYVYRPSGPGTMVGYDLHLDDSVICRVSNNTKQKIFIKKEGPISLWAKTEAKSDVPLNVEFGREYYLRCTIGMGVMVGHPKLQLIDGSYGDLEYDAIGND